MDSRRKSSPDRMPKLDREPTAEELARREKLMVEVYLRILLVEGKPIA